MSDHFTSSDMQARIIEDANPDADASWQGLPVRIMRENGNLILVHFGGDQPAQWVRRSDVRRRRNARPPTNDS